MRPPAYILSSYSTVSGKKSCPSLGSFPMVAAAKTTESANWTVTDPPACAASLPVSNVKGRPPTVVMYFLLSGFINSPNCVFPAWLGTES